MRTKQERLALLDEVDLYPVTGAAFSRGRSTMEIVEAVRDAGCKIVQLREKDLSVREYYELAKQIRAMTRGMLLICNDHLDVALAVGADGVHLGNDDLPVDAARRLAPELVIGASSHDLGEALAAQAAGADYVNIGPIFPTGTKQGVARFLGPEAISRIAPHLSVPFTVMGGIKASNLHQVLEQGARRVAVVTAVTAADDPRGAAESLRERIRQARGADAPLR